MSKKLESLLEIPTEELKVKLKETYEKQKLRPILRKVARIIEILVCVAFVIVEGATIYGGLFLLLGLYAGYRLMKPKAEDEVIYSELDELAIGIESFKKYRDKRSVEYDEELARKIEKEIKRYLPRLLKTSIIGKTTALIPVINLFADETFEYTHMKNGALSNLLNGSAYLKNQGLRKFIELDLV